MKAVLVSLTCDDTTDVCPGTELTCTCSVINDTGLIWTLPGSGVISIDDKGEFSSNVTTNGIFIAVLTNNTVVALNNTGGILESMLIYTATKSLVNLNDTIVCSGNGGAGAMSTTITVTLAG